MARVCGWSSSPRVTAISGSKLCHLHLAMSPSNLVSFGPTLQTSGIPTTRKKHTHTLVCSLQQPQHDDVAAAAAACVCDAPVRRVAILQITFSALFHLSSPALALTDAPPQFRLYSDDINKYQMSIPQDWQVGAGKTDGVRSLTAFYPQLDSASNVSVLITGIGPDFTRMESFGKVDAFAETLVSGLDRSWQRPPGVAAKLLDCKAAKGLYYIEYTLQNPGESRRHIYSAIGMANNGWYNRLYTVTGQYVDEEADKYSSMIEKAVNSFKFS